MALPTRRLGKGGGGGSSSSSTTTTSSSSSSSSSSLSSLSLSSPMKRAFAVAIIILRRVRRSSKLVPIVLVSITFMIFVVLVWKSNVNMDYNKIVTATTTADADTQQQKQQATATGSSSSINKSNNNSNNNMRRTNKSNNHNNSNNNNRPNGVFVIKAARAEDTEKVLCSLTAFFNAKHQYPVRIFVDTVQNTRPDIVKYAAGADVQVIPDVKQSWTKLPDTLNETEKQRVLASCHGMDQPETAKCTAMKFSLGYVHMNYWNYAKMPYEDTLQEFEYIINFDNDAFLTQPLYVDPFRVMADNDLIGIFDIEAFQGGHIASGVQEISERLFPAVADRKDIFLDDGTVRWFDSDGVWRDPDFQDENKKPSIWTHFWGCRRDFFDDARYKAFAAAMTVYTYLYRVDEQPIIGTAWALLLDAASRRRVWYLPRHGIYLGVFHHGWVDNREMLWSGRRMYKVNPLITWNNDFQEHPNETMLWEDYLMVTGQNRDICQNANGPS